MAKIKILNVLREQEDNQIDIAKLNREALTITAKIGELIRNLKVNSQSTTYTDDEGNTFKFHNINYVNTPFKKDDWTPKMYSGKLMNIVEVTIDVSYDFVNEETPATLIVEPMWEMIKIIKSNYDRINFIDGFQLIHVRLHFEHYYLNGELVDNTVDGKQYPNELRRLVPQGGTNFAFFPEDSDDEIHSDLVQQQMVEPINLDLGPLNNKDRSLKKFMTVFNTFKKGTTRFTLHPISEPEDYDIEYDLGYIGSSDDITQEFIKGERQFRTTVHSKYYVTIKLPDTFQDYGLDMHLIYRKLQTSFLKRFKQFRMNVQMDGYLLTPDLKITKVS